MKLYIWEEVWSLADYSPGVAVAHAKNKKAAINAIIGTHENDTLRDELERTEPDVVTAKEYGYSIIGSA